MSIHIVKEQINNFLLSATPEVLAIRGKWGVGKTFAWNKFITEAKDKEKIALEKYSYVSLFGINSLDSLKFAMFQQLVNKKSIGTEPNLATFKSNFTDVIKRIGRKAIPFLQGFTFVKNVAPSLESAAFLFLNGSLICIDDLERKGRGLDLQDVLGLVSVLKEQKKCKIVLILNDEYLREEASDDYKTFREKVIDMELLFEPTPDDCAEIVLSGENEVYSKLRSSASNLRINNIRILGKIERLGNIMDRLLAKYESEVRVQAMQSLTLFTWCYYANKDDIPTLDYLKNIGNDMIGLGNGEHDDEQKKQWRSMLREYGFQFTDEFDLEIAKSVETGYVNKDALIGEAEKLNKRVVSEKSINSFISSWRSYHDSFDDNEDEVLKDLYEGVKRNVEYMNPMKLDGVIRLFRKLDENELADEMIDIYINRWQNEKDMFDLDHYSFGEHVKDSKIIEKFNSLRDTSKEKKTIGQVLSDITGKDSWGDSDEEVLAQASVEEFIALFKKEKGDHLSDWIETCLRFGRIRNASERHKKIAKNATDALTTIGGESRINALRVAKFGIKIEDNSN